MQNHHAALALAAAALSFGCSDRPSIVGCADGTVCTLFPGGQCLPAPVGFDVCAYPDTECPSGFSWSPQAGDLAGECVPNADVDAGTDADTSIDGANVGCPARIAFTDGATNALEVYSANPDGTGVTNLSADASNDARPHWSTTGDLVAFESNRTGNYEIFTVAAGGSIPRNITQHPDIDQRPAISPDGTKIAFSRRSGATSTLWVVDIDGSNARELSSLPCWATNPISWSPDSTRIAFVANGVVHSVALAGGTTNLCAGITGTCSNPAWSPDGAHVALTVYANANSEIYVVDANGSNPTNITNNASGDDSAPSWSPDSTAIAFASTRNGQYEIFRTAYPVSGAPLRLTMHDNTINDFGPQWSADGTRLAFVRNQTGGSRIATMTADGTSYTDFAVNANPGEHSWSPCQ